MKIGHINIDRPIALAPMEDVSDLSFRGICKEHGADLVYTEFTSSEALIRNVKSAKKKIAISEDERPIAIQLYGSVEASMEEAARIATAVGPDFIDINCGCWVKKIAMRGDGAGLLRDINKFESVVQAVMAATHLPVTVKTRLGWDSESIVILDVARMLEANGVQALTVHCRTRKQGYSGRAEWDWLARINDAVPNLPLMGNGDAVTPQDVKDMFDRGCDGVMIGRGAITNPWIFNQAKHYLATGELPAEPTLEERVDMCIEHLTRAAAYKGERRAVLEFRKHYGGYLKGMPHIAKLRASLMEFETIAPIEDRIRQYLKRYAAQAAA